MKKFLLPLLAFSLAIFTITAQPVASVNPLSLTVNLSCNDTVTQALTINNTGTANLNFNLYDRQTSFNKGYVANYTSDNMNVVDLNTNSFIGGLFPAGNGAYFSAIHPLGDRVYFSDYDDNSVTVVSTGDNSIIGNIPLGLGAQPNGISITPDGKFCFVANTNATVTKIDCATNSVVATLVTNISNAQDVAFSLNGDFVYISDIGNNRVAVFSQDADTFVTAITGIFSPYFLVASPDGQFIYVSEGNGATSYVKIISTATNTLVDSVSHSSNCYGLDITPDGKFLYVLSSSNQVLVINTATKTISTTIFHGNFGNGWDLELSPAGDFCYVICSSLPNVVVISTATNTVVSTMNTNGIDPYGIGTLNSWAIWMSQSVSSGTISAGGNNAVDVKFNSTGLVAGTYTGSIYLNSNDPVTSQILIPCTMNVSGTPDINITLAGSCPEFDSVQTTFNDPDTFLIENFGCDTLFITGISSSSNQFTVNSYPGFILPNSSMEAIISFTPTVPAGNKTTAITVYNNDADTTFCLSGVAIADFDSISPASFNITINSCNDSVMDTLTVYNSGLGDYIFNLTDIDTTSSLDLSLILDRVNQNYTTITNEIPSVYLFSDGITGNYINDGGNDMYDGGNYLNTNLGAGFAYSDNTIISSGTMGPGGKYFTRKNPGLFVFAADISGLNYFEITGNNGADGSGNADATVLSASRFGKNFKGYVKRVYNAGDPSINHLIIVGDDPGTSHSFSAYTDNDFHHLDGIQNITRIYYLLYASSGGDYIDNAITQNIFNKFLEVIISSPEFLTSSILGDTVISGDSVKIPLEFNSTNMASGQHTSVFYLNSNDPDEPYTAVQCTLNVDGVPSMSLSDTCFSFGSKMVGTATTDTLTVINSGCDTLFLTSITNTLAHFVPGASSLMVPPFQSRELIISFAPAAVGSFNDTIQITSNDGNKSVCLSGTGIPQATISANPASFNVTINNCNDSLTQTLTIDNIGGSDLYFNTQFTSTDSFNYAYICNAGSNTVSVLNTKTNNIIKTIPVGSYPWRVAIRPDARYAYVCNRNSNNVSVINTYSNAVESAFAIGGIPGGIGITPDSRFAYVSDRTNNNVKKIDLVSGSVVSTLNDVNFNDPRDIEITRDGSRGFVSTNNSGLTIFDVASDVVIGNIPSSGGQQTHSVVITPDGKFAYFSEPDNNDVKVINTSTLAIEFIIPGFDNPSGLDIDPSGDFLYVNNNWGSEIVKVKISTNSVVSSIWDNQWGNPWDFIVSNDGIYGYFSDPNMPNVSIVDLGSFTILGTFSPGLGTRGMATLKRIIPSFVNLSVYSDTVNPGGASLVDVEFNALNLVSGIYISDLLLNSNDPSNPLVVVPCTMTVAGSAIMELSKNCMYLDSIVQFGTHQDSLYIKNTGCDTLMISNITKQTPEFSISFTSASILPYDSLALVITFSPATTGDFFDTLTVFSNAGDSLICLSGEAYPNPIICWDPDTFFVTLGCNDSATFPLDLCNSGGSDLLVSISDTDGCPEAVLYDDFEDGDFAGWITGSCGVTYSVVNTDPAEGAKSLSMAGGCNTYWEGLKQNFGTSAPPYISYWAKPTVTNLNQGYFVIGQSPVNITANQIAYIYFRNNGSLYMYGGTLYTDVYSANSWYHIELRNINYSTRRFDYYLNGVLRAASVSFRGTNTTVDEVQIFNYHNSTAYFDNILIGSCTSPTWLNPNPPYIDVVAGGDTNNYSVDFNSTGLVIGQYSGNITVSSNDPLNPTVEIPCLLNVVGTPELTLSKNCMYLDSIMEFTAMSDSLFIKNTGCDTLMISNVSTQTAYFLFSLVSDTVFPGDSTKLTVTFSPDSMGDFFDTLTVFTNTGDSLICLSGKGFPRPEISVNPDSFNISLNCAGSLIDTLTIYNTGLNTLNYSIDTGNYVLSLDGSGDYVNFPVGVVLGNNFTEEAWIFSRHTADNSYHGFLGYQPGAVNQRAPCMYVYNGTRIHGGFGTGSSWNAYTTGPVITPNTWTHIAQTFDGTTLRCLVNGVEVYSTTAYSGQTPYANPVRWIGRTDNYLNGNMDEVRLWNYARTAAQLTAGMNKKLLGTEPGLRGYWNFDKVNANDKTSGGNNGSLVGNAAIVYSETPFKSYFDLNGTLSGTIATDDSVKIAVEFNSSGLIVGNYFDSLVVVNNDPLGNPTIVPVNISVAGTAEISLSQNCLYLDSIMEYTTNKDTFYVKNTGCDSLFISNITKQTANFSVTPLQDTILMLDSAAFVVTFSPTSVGDFFDTLTIFSNTGDSLFCLSGKAFGKPVISFNPDSFNITISCGDTFVDTVKIYNSGASDLTYSLSTQSLGTTGTITYSETFINGQTPSGAQSTGWVNFRAQLISALPYTKLKFYGSNNITGVTLTDPTAITNIANALRTSGSMNVTTQGNTWYVGNCGSSPALSVNTTVCNCDGANPTVYVIRPQIGNTNWGGVNTSTCSGPTQTITVEFTYGTPFMSLSMNADTVVPGDSSEVAVTFNAAGLNVGTYSGIIAISSNDPSSPNDTIPVILNVVGTAELSLTKNCMYLDSIMEYTTKADSLYVKNTGCDTMFITNVTGQTGDFLFTFSGDTLLPGDSAKLTVIFSPADTGSFFDTLTVFSNVGDSLICLSGKAFDRPIQTHYPDTINVTLACADTLSDTLTIYNTGLNSLIFNPYTKDTTHGKSAVFDGSGDYIINGTSMTGSFINETVTMEVWFKANAAGVIIDELGQVAINTGWHDSQMEINSTGQVRVRVWSLGSVLLGTVSFGTWNHAVLRYNKSTLILDGMLNGIEAATDVSGDRSAPWESSFGQFYALGATDGTNMGSGGYFNGRIDEFRVWNTARTNAQLQSNMYRTLYGNESGLVAYWNFNDGTATDFGPNTFDGTFSGNATTSAPNAPISPSWMKYLQGTDTILPGDSSKLAVEFSSTGLLVGQYFSNITVYSNDPLNSPDTVPVILNVVGAPALVLSDSCVSFDTIMEFTNIVDTLMITNTGCDTLFISAETSLNFFIDSLTIDSVGGYIIPGDTEYLQVIFAPDSAGDFSGTLTLNTNDYDTVICLFGVAFPRPVLSSSPDTIEVTAICADTIVDTLTVYNTGLSDLIFSTSSTGMSAMFDGVNDNMSTTLNIDQGGTVPLTLEAWVYPTSNSAGNHQVISTDNGGSDWSILRSAGTWFVFTGSGSTNTGFSVDLNQWQHLAAVFIPGTGVKFYKNGVEFSTATISFDASDGNINLGRTPSNTSFFDGRIDEARVWNIQRSQADIISTMNKKLYGDETGLRGYWHFDNGTTNDFSGNGFNGTLNNGASVSIPNAPVSDAWLTYSAVVADTVFPGDSSQIGFLFVSTGLIVGQHVSNILISSNDPLNLVDTATFVLNVIGAPEMTLSQNCLYLDSIMEFTSNTDTFYIKNSGCDTLFITNITGQTTQFAVTPLMDTILVLDSSMFIVTFSPDSAGDFFDTLTVFSNAGDSLLCLSGKAFDRPIISFNPDTLSITLTCADSLTDTLTIYNTGLTDLIFNNTPPGLCAVFDGSGDYIDVPDNNSLDLPSTITFETWLFVDTIQEIWTSIIGKPGRNYTMWLNNGRYIHLSYNGPGNTTINTPPNSINIKQWQHIAGVIDVNSGVMKVYIDGIEQASGSSAGSANLSGSPFRMSNNLDGGSGNFLHGKLDEVRVWNVARTQSEIQSTIYKSILGTEPGLVGYWNFDDGTAVDLSVNANNGVFYGNATTANPNNPLISEFSWVDYYLLSDTLSFNDSVKIPISVNSTGLLVGQYISNIIFNSNDPLNNPDTVPLILYVVGAPAMVLSDSCLAFDTIMEFTNITDTLFITNTGCDTLFLSALSTSNFFVDSMFKTSLIDTVLPGVTDSLLVFFAPDSAGDFTGTLSLTTNDYDTVICLNGVAFQRPILSVIPDTIVLNYSVCCDSVVVPITIYNTGGSDLNWIITTTGGFFDDVESGPGNWVKTGLWHQETFKSSSPVTSWTYNTGSPNYNFATGTNSGSLTSESIDLTALSPSVTTTFSFNCYYQTETPGTSWDQRWIQVSVNGGPFNNYIQLSGESMNTWHQHSYDFSTYNGNSIRLRYYFNSVDGVGNTYWGWSVDNISVISDAATCNSFLCMSPDSGTAAVGDSSIVDLEFNSCGVQDGTYTADLVVMSNDPLNPTDTIHVVFVMDNLPEFEVFDSCAVFDTIMEFTSVVDTFLIANTGCDTLFIDGNVTANFQIMDSSGVFASSVTGFILPGDTVSVPVKFLPDSVGNFTGTLTWNTNDYDTVICLNGVSFPRPIISVVPDTVTATISFCQDSVNVPLYIYNSGGSYLNYSVDDSPLWISANPNSGTIPASGSDSTLVTVFKSGLSFGVNNFLLPVSSNDPLDTLLNIVFSITVDSVPPPPPAAFDTSICFGSPTPDLIATGDSIRWYDDGLLTNLVATGDTFVTGASAVGSYTFYVTNTDTATGCASQADTVTLEINSPPAEPVATDTTVCSSDLIPDLVSTGTNVKWYSDAALTTLVFSGDTFITGQTSAGTYTYYVTDSLGGCAASPADTSVLVINDAAVADAGTPVDSICEGSAYYVSGTISGGASTIIWTTSGDGTFDYDTALIALYTPGVTDISTGSVTLTISTDDPDGAGPCPAVSDDLVLIIMPEAIVNAGVDSTICSGSIYTLAGSFGGGASGITWTSSGSGTFDNSNSITATYTPSAADISSGTLSLIITTNDPDGPCSSAADSLVLTLNPAATVNAGSDAIICTGSTYTLEGTRGGGASTSLWTTSGDGTFDDAASLTPVYTPGVTDLTNGNVTLTITTDDPAGPCTSVLDTMSIIINATPAVPSSPDTTVCSDATIPNLTASGTNIQWYSDASLSTLVGTGITFNTLQTLPGSYEYWLTDSLTGCPASAADSATLTINEAATADAGLDSVICEGSTFTLAGTMSGSATTVNWTTSGDGTFDNATLLTAAYDPGATDISNGSVILTITTDDPDAAGPCAAAVDAMILTIYPAALVNAGSDDTICEGSTYVLSGTMGGGSTSITWITSGNGTFSNVNLLTATYTPSANDISAGFVFLKITSNDPSGPCPSVIDSMRLTINPIAIVYAGADTTICSTQTLTLSGTSAGSTSSTEWITSGDGSFSDSSLLAAIYYPGTNDISTGNATLTITTNDPDSTGPCSAVSDQLILIINSTPPAPVADDTTVCSDAAIPYLTTSGTNVQWYSDASLSTLVGTGITFNTLQTLPDSYEYWLTDSLTGCPASAADSATLTINEAATADAGLDSVICEGSSYTLAGTIGGSASTITWATSGDGTFDNATLLTAIYNPGSTDISNGIVTLAITTDDPDAAGPCAAAVDAMILTIKPAATVDAGVADTICQGSTSSLSGTIGGGATNATWSTLGDGTFDNISSLTAIYTPGSADISAETVLLQLTTNDPAGPCQSVTNSVSIKINIAATVNAGADDAICVGNSFTLGGTRGGGAISSTWTTSGDGTFNDSSLLGAIYTPGVNDEPAGSVTLYLTTNDPDTAGPCSSVIDSLVLTINSNPAEPVALDTTICEGEPTPDLNAGGTILQWYSDGSLNNLVFTGSSFASGNSAPGSFTYYVTDSISGCPASPADTSSLVINPMPSIPLANDTSVCDGSAIPDLVAVGDSIRWYDDGALTNLVAGNDTLVPGVSAVGVYTYYATQTDLISGCQGLSDTVVLTINAIPSAPMTADDTICEGNPTPDLVAAGSNIQWFNDAGLSVLEFSGDSFASGDTAAGVYTYYATQTVNNCPSPASTVVFTIFATPSAPVASDTSVCDGSPNPPLIASGTNIQWYSDSLLSVPVFSGDSFVAGDTSPGSYTYFVNQEINACPGSGTAATLTIKPIPVAPVSSDTSICSGDPVPDLTATGANLQWYSDPGLTILAGTGSPFSTGNTAVGSYTYYVNDSLNDCGAGPATTVTLTISTLPVTPPTVDASSCFGDSVPSLVATGTNIQWYSDSGLTTLLFSGDSFATGDIGAGSYTYYATSSSSGCGESTPDSATLTIFALPLAPVTTGAGNCAGSPADTLVASGTNITWYSDSALTISVGAGNAYSPGDSAVGIFTYYATQTDSVTGCVSVADSASLSIFSLPAAPVSWDTFTVYGNPVPDLIAFGTNVQWYSDSALMVFETSGNVFATGDTAIGTYTYFVSQSDSVTGCEGTPTIVTLSILPGAPFTTGTSSCESDSVLDLAATGLNILWYSDSALTNLVDSGNNFTPSDSLAGTYTYYATQTVNGTESSAASVTMTINPLPAAPSTSGDVSVCENDGIPVLVASGTNINWYSDSALTIFIANNDSLVTGQSLIGNYTYYATETLLGCEGAASSVILTIMASPPSPVAADSSTCFGNPVPDLFASGTNILWYSDSALSAFEFAGNTFATGNAAAGVYTYYAVDTLNGCTSPFTQVELLISAPASAPISASSNIDSICPSSPVLLAVSGTLSVGTVWKWYSSSCGGTFAGNGDSLIVSPSVTTTYFVRAEGGCDTTSCVSVTVNVSNNLSVASSGSYSDVDSICPGNSATLSVGTGTLGTGATWQWYDASCGGITLGNGDSVSVNPAVTTTYFVRAEGTCNTTACDSVTVNINVPAAPLANNETVCEGQPVPDLVAIGSDLNWYDDSLLTNNVFGNDTFSTGQSAAGFYTYYVTETNGSGCEGPATTVSLTINAIPDVPALSDEIGCEGGVIPDLIATGTFISWYSDSALTNLLSTNDTFVTGNSVLGVYTYYVTDSVVGCEGPSAAVTLTINPLPAAPVTADGNGCSGDSVANVFAAGSNIQWYSDSSLMTLVSSGDTLSPGLLPVGTYTYYATQTVNGCESPADSAFLTVNITPSAPVTSDETICEGSPTPDLVVLGTGVTWYADSLLSNTLYQGSVFATGVTATGIYTYYVTDIPNMQTGCVSYPAVVTLTINAVPAVPAVSDVMACESGIIPDLYAGGSNVNWYNDSSLTTFVNSGNSFATGQTAIGSYTYYVIDSVAGCVSGTGAVTLTISSVPVAPSGTNETVCFGDTTPDLSVSGSNITWYSEPMLIYQAGTGNNLATGKTQVGIYTFYATQTVNGCTSPFTSVSLSINPNPQVTLNTYFTTISAGQSVTLIAYNAGIYSWTPTTGLNTSTNDTVIAAPGSVTTYTVTGSNAFGCSNSASVTVDVWPVNIEEPSVDNLEFSIYPNPNKGDFNVQITGINNSSDYELKIYNMLGEVVYRSAVNSQQIEVEIKLHKSGSGVYYVQMISEKGVMTKRVIVE